MSYRIIIEQVADGQENPPVIGKVYEQIFESPETVAKVIFAVNTKPRKSRAKTAKGA